MLRFRWITFDRFKVVNLSRFYRVNFIRPYWVNFTVFSKYRMYPVQEGFGQFRTQVDVVTGQTLVTVSKDWRRVRVHLDAAVLDIPVTEADFNRFLKAKTDYIQGGAPSGSSSASSPGSTIDTDTNGQFPGNKHGYYTCPSCHGSGRCPHCDGKGIARNSYGRRPDVLQPLQRDGQMRIVRR